MQKSCAVVIPVYNERGAILETVKRLKGICAQGPEYDSCARWLTG